MVDHPYVKPCKYFGSAAGCRYGYNCRDSHDNPSSITLCRNYIVNSCRFGNNCFYRHNIYKSDTINKNHNNLNDKTQELCTYFNSPYGCSRKDKCRYKHIKQEKPEQDGTVRLYSMHQLNEMKLNIPKREWRKISDSTQSSSSSSSNILTVVQFNCLAQSLCYGVTDRVTFKCDKKYLIWEYRCKRILYDILQYKPDIICLQEIDNIHFKSFFKPNLSSNKYKGIFKVKNNLNINSSHISLNDGIAIFWNINKLCSLNEEEIFECILGDKSECCQVALGIRLYLKENKSLGFDVWNTHLKAGRTNESEDKRIKQCKILKNCMKQYSDKMPIIFCGDLNLHFEDLINDKGIVVQANAYKYLTSYNYDEMKDDENDVKLIFKSLWNDKDINRFSCFAGWKDRNVKACFDYIMIGNWINDGNNDEKNKTDFFVVEEILNGFKEKEIEKFESRLPNENYSSDHFLIATKVAIQK